MKSAVYKIKGMQLDISPSAFSELYAFETRNIKITPSEDNTFMSITNNKGTLDTGIKYQGILLGTAEFENSVILFTCKQQLEYSDIIKDVTIQNFNVNDEEIADIPDPMSDHIYEVYKDSIKELFSGNLNFNKDYPIETLIFQENKELTKVYWTDNYNYPRFLTVGKDINIKTLDFFPTMNLKEKITIVKHDTLQGMFPAGTIQYVFTYIKKLGQQSNIFYASPLYFITGNDNGLSVNKVSSNSFLITLDNLDTDYDYVRIYSVIRTSLDTVPEVKVVKDIPIKQSIVYEDTHTEGYIIDPTELLFIGGEPLMFGTMTLKDNTLFFGDIKTQTNYFDKEFKERFTDIDIKYTLDKKLEADYEGTYYKNNFQLNKSSDEVRIFKLGETYRFGILFQHKTGKWSEAVFIKDLENDTTIVKQDGFIKLPVAKALFNDKDLISKLLIQGYKKARPVIVYPEFKDRTIICQGYLNPTVYNVKDRSDNIVHAQSSWFARPNFPENVSYTYKDENQKGALIEFRHNYSISGRYTRHHEIQSSILLDGSTAALKETTNLENWKNLYGLEFFVDSSIVTLHSPELELDESLHNTDLSNYNIRIIGIVPMTSTYSDLDIITSTGPQYQENISPAIPLGLYKKLVKHSNISSDGHRCLCSGIYWIDTLNFRGMTLKIGEYDSDYNLKDYVNTTIPNDVDLYKYTGYHIHPFMGSGSLSHGEYSLLQYKKLSNVKFSSNTIYFKDPILLLTSDINIFNSDTDTSIRLKKDDEILFYKGNVDSIIVSKRKKPDTEDIVSGYVNYYSPGFGYISGEFFNLTITLLWDNQASQDAHAKIDPIYMRYKSTPHGVISLKKEDNTLHILPTLNNLNKINDVLELHKLFWEFNKEELFLVTKHFQQESVQKDNQHGWLWLAEIYRKNVSNRFGGTSLEAIANNTWLPCGEAVDLDLNGFEVIWKEGDTYYQRYDNIKTYPYSLEEVNGITEMVSFMVETRINLDGRYDENRGLLSNLHVFPDNTNLINKTYNQKNNMFVYNGKDSQSNEVNYYPNLVSWSKTKTEGELVDTWTNLTLASTINLDGTKGKLTALRNINSKLLGFQEKSILQILFNENTQIVPAVGVPIEIANSGKVQGSYTYADNIGCQYKESICITPLGVYFIDTLNKGIFRLSDKLDNISQQNGMSSYFKKQNLNNYKTFYDKINQEVLFSNEDSTTVFSEFLNSFTSFYDIYSYDLYNIKDRRYLLHDNKVWGYQQGEYNKYFNINRPYYVTLLCNPEPLVSKTFQSLEFVSDSFKNNVVQPNNTFNKLEIKTEYQSGVSELQYNQYLPNTLKRKFRIWRTSIPRDSKYPLNKIRDNWAYITLKKDSDLENIKTELHDIVIYYT